jgi:hypothetical protein
VFDPLYRNAFFYFVHFFCFGTTAQLDGERCLTDVAWMDDTDASSIVDGENKLRTR